MARSITGSVQIVININDQNSRGLGSESIPVQANYSQTFVYGAGAAANELNELWQDLRTLAAGASEEIDLAGSLVGNFGLTVAFAKIKLIYIEIVETTPAPSGLSVGGAAATQFADWVGDAASDKVKLQTAGAMLLMSKKISGYAVAGGSTDKLKITNLDGSNGLTYKIIVLGNQ